LSLRMYVQRGTKKKTIGTVVWPRGSLPLPPLSPFLFPPGFPSFSPPAPFPPFDEARVGKGTGKTWRRLRQGGSPRFFLLFSQVFFLLFFLFPLPAVVACKREEKKPADGVAGAKPFFSPISLLFRSPSPPSPFRNGHSLNGTEVFRPKTQSFPLLFFFFFPLHLAGTGDQSPCKDEANFQVKLPSPLLFFWSFLFLSSLPRARLRRQRHAARQRFFFFLSLFFFFSSERIHVVR